MRDPSLFSDAIATPSVVDRTGRVISATPLGVDVEMDSGEVVRRLPLSGATKYGETVRMRYSGGRYTVLGNQAMSASNGASAGATAPTGGGASGLLVHDLLGAYHNLPSVGAATFFAGPTGTTGTPSFRGLALSDFQTPADTRYVPLTRTLTGGNGINTIGDLSANRTISVNYGAGLNLSSGALVVGTPTTLGTGTLNAVSGTTHAHQVDYTTTAANSKLVSTGTSGEITGKYFNATGALAVYNLDDRTNGAPGQWAMYADNGLLRFYRGSDKATIDTNGYLQAARVGAGVSPANVFHGRGASNQLRLDIDALNYAIFNVGGSGDIDLTLNSSTRFFKYNNFAGTGTFLSGFTGSGWRLDTNISRSGAASLELDDLTVRGRMRVYELLIHQIRFGNGSYLFTSGMKVKTVTGTGPYTLTSDSETPHGLSVGDLCRAQRFTGSGTYQSNIQITFVANPYTVTATLVSGDAPAVDMEFARIGNVSDTDRQGAVYITADESNAPYIDITDGVSSFSDWGGSAKNKARLGKLTGITDSFWGTLSGYGIYTNFGYFRNVKINGSAIIGNGVGFSIAPLLYCAYDTPPNGLQPNTNGHLGQRATLAGGVSGVPGRHGGALAIGQAGINLVTNPRFGHGTPTTNWTTGANCTLTASTIAYVGTTAGRAAFSGTNNRRLDTAVTRASTGNNLFASAWVKAESGVAQIRIGIYKSDLSAAASLSAVYTIDSTNWTYIGSLASSAAMTGFGTSVRVLISNDSDNGVDKNVIVGFVQAEETFFSTPAIAGDLGSGYSWSGTPHASSSSRTAAGLSYTPAGNLPSGVGSVSAWFWCSNGNSGSFSGNRVILHTNTIPQLVLRVNPSNLMEGAWGSTAFSGGTVTPFQWNLATLACDGTTARLFLNGVEVATSTTIAAIGQSTIHVGSYQGANQWINGFVDDLFVTTRAMTLDEHLAIYTSNSPINVSRSNYELVLSEPGVGKVVANAGGIYGTATAGTPNFTLLNSDQTLNSESLGEGDVMFGDNSTGEPNLLWDNSTGKLSFRSGVTEYGYFDGANWRIGRLADGVSRMEATSSAVNFIRRASGVDTNFMALDATGTGSVRIGEITNGFNHVLINSTAFYVNERRSGTTYARVQLDSTGLRLKDNVGGDRVLIDSSGNILLKNAAGANRVSIDSSGVLALKDSSATDRIVLDGSGNLNIKNSAGTNVITFDGSGNSSFADVMGIGTSGMIRQGTGTWLVNFQGMVLRNLSGLGRIEFYESSSTQFATVMDADGMRIRQGAALSGRNSIRWLDASGTHTGEVAGYTDSTYNKVFLWGSGTTGKYGQTTIYATGPAPFTNNFAYGIFDSQTNVIDFLVAGAGAGRLQVTANGTEITNGSLRVPRSSTISGIYGADATALGSSVSAANNGTISLFGGSNTFGGLLIIHETASDLSAAIFLVHDGIVSEVSDPSSNYSHTVGTATSTNVYMSGGVVTVENKRGGNRTYNIYAIRTRGAN